MRITGAFALSLSLGAAVAVASAASHAKGAAKKGGGGSAPAASSAEVNKLKAVRLGDPKAGTFKWGMKPEEVMAQVRTAVEAKYEPRIDKARQDPGLQQRIRDEMARELKAVKASYTKFEGQKTGWDVSIVGPEFQQNTSEAVIVTKEDIWTRYFFFFEDGLYKMFLGFNKDAIGGKNFAEFGKGMESKYGNAREVYRDDKTKRRRHPQAGSLRVVGGRRRSAEADRSLRVLRRLLPRAVRRIGPGSRRRAAQGRQPRRRQQRRAG